MALCLLQAERDRLHVAYIPADFIDTSMQAFDQAYMAKLYDLGFRLAQAGYPWKKTPPRMNTQ
jgi:hypothetical protein